MPHKTVLVVFTGRTTDKFLIQSFKDGSIITPSTRPLIQDGTLFLFDDVSALEVEYPPELVEALCNNNAPTILVDAQDLARDLVPILPRTDNVTVLSGGGVLSYLFLRQTGYTGELREIIEIERTYTRGVPTCSLKRGFSSSPELVLDDILASGQTLLTALSGKELPAFVCFLASANIPKGKKGYRSREGSTVPGISKLYCAQLVNGIPVNGPNMKPAILSMRYLLTKAVDNADYRGGYLGRKFGSQSAEIVDLVRRVDREPIENLRADPLDFLRNRGY